MRLIDADKLLDDFQIWPICDDCAQLEDTKCELSGEYICLAIQNAPTVDAVPVVRCRDCKYFMEHNDGQGGNCNHLDYDGEYEFSVAGDWFCADGERREAKSDG